MFVMQNTLLSFLNSVDMSGSENVYGYICYCPLNISYQALNVGLWPKIEGFCDLHAKLMVIYSYNIIFFQVSMYEQFTVFSYSLYSHSPVMCLINIQKCI